MERKFKNYVIKTILNDEIIHIYNGIISYKEALSIYKDTKEKNKDKATVEFHGETSDSKFQLLFKKEYKQSLVQTNTFSTIDIINNMHQLQNVFKQRKEYIDNLAGTYDKEKEVFWHTVENTPKDALDEIKVNIFNQMQQLSESRRDYKNEKRLIDSLTGQKFMESFDDMYGKVNGIHNKIKAEKRNAVSNKSSNSMDVKYIPYRTHKERIRLFSNAQKKYDRVWCDEDNRQIVCYNKCYEGKGYQFG